MLELLPLVAIVLLFWLLIIRPAQKRNRQLGQMQSSLNEGDRVMLSAGIVGTVDWLDDQQAGIEIAPGVTITVVRGAIGSVVPESDALEPTDELEPADEPGDTDAYDDYDEPDQTTNRPSGSEDR